MYPAPICKAYTFNESQHWLEITCRLNMAACNPQDCNQTMEENMAQAQRNEAANYEQSGWARPVKSLRQGGVKVDVWCNAGQNGDMYNTTISNSYKDDATGEWKDTKSFSSTDLAVVSQLSSQAFQAITELKSQSRGR
jgi:hypothetical protein